VVQCILLFASILVFITRASATIIRKSDRLVSTYLFTHIPLL